METVLTLGEVIKANSSRKEPGGGLDILGETHESPSELLETMGGSIDIVRFQLPCYISAVGGGGFIAGHGCGAHGNRGRCFEIRGGV